MNLKWIGPYLSNRFINESYWGNVQIEIKSKEELLYFVSSRRITDNTRQRFMNWLTRILTNRRSSECVGDAKIRRGRLIQYNVRNVNQKGWNSVIDYLRNELIGNPIREYLPSKKRARPIMSYPNRCIIG
jgi:hypothetical protein